MKIFGSATAALVLAASAVSVDASLMDYLRGSSSSVYDHSVESYVGQFACTLSGGSKYLLSFSFPLRPAVV